MIVPTHNPTESNGARSTLRSCDTICRSSRATLLPMEYRAGGITRRPICAPSLYQTVFLGELVLSDRNVLGVMLQANDCDNTVGYLTCC